MLKNRSTRFCQGQWTLIGLLVAVAIVLILTANTLQPFGGGPSIVAPHSAPGQPPTPRQRAYNAACSEYQSQINQAVMLYKTDHDDRPPANLEQLKRYGVTDEMLHARDCYFTMDPATGTVTNDPNGPPPVAPGGYQPSNPVQQLGYHPSWYHPADGR